MVPDLDFVRKAFLCFNERIFSGKLPLPGFSLTRARTFRGKFTYRISRNLLGTKAHDFVMRLSILFDLPEAEWEDVVIHEMIHLYIASNGINDRSSHGPQFRKMMHLINSRHGRNIRISVRSKADGKESPHPDRRVRSHYVGIARFKDGGFGFAPVAKTKIFHLWDMGKYFPDLVSLTWIGSLDPFFNSFPHIRSPKLYKIDAETLESHLRGAQPLQKTGSVIKVLPPRPFSEITNKS